MKTHEIELTVYRNFRPSQFDASGLGCNDQQDWLVAPCGQNRDSDTLTRCNFECQAEMLREIDPGYVDHETHRFGHWGPGWFEIVLVRPGTPAHRAMQELAAGLADYPVVNEMKLSEMETEEANEVWADNYDTTERINYIRRNRHQFDFHDFADLLGCVRGKYFAGFASELLSR